MPRYAVPSSAFRPSPTSGGTRYARVVYCMRFFDYSPALNTTSDLANDEATVFAGKVG